MSSKLSQSIRTRVERIRTAPGDELGNWTRLARFQVRLWLFCARRLRENNVSAMSAALSFRTIFALIPTLVLVVVIMQAVGVLEDSKQSLNAFLRDSGFAQITAAQSDDGEQPDAGQQTDAREQTETGEPAPRMINVAEEVERIVGEVEGKLSVQRVGPIGVVLLIWTALTLITTIERSLNRIFDAHRPRPAGQRLVLYWAILSLGPLVAVAASYAGQQATGAMEGVWGLSWLVAVAGWVAPILMGILVVAAVYWLLPNTAVRFSEALGGAIVSVPLWLIAKWAFGMYVARLVGPGHLYGTLGLLPMFLIWLNLSWWILLFGAQLAHAAANLGAVRLGQRAEEQPREPADLLAVAIAVTQQHHDGKGPATPKDVARCLRLPHEQVVSLLDRLVAKTVICPVEADADAESGGAYVPHRPADKIALLDVIGLDARSLGRTGNDQLDRTLARAVARTNTALDGCTLADVMDEREAIESPRGSE
ncbi:MAG: YihY/virulence factor BrkB family protein [bacterium]|nr:YihY/virulence factor BrkB family protein [bacterium]